MTWLNNIPNIPGLSDSVSAANLMRQNSITNSADHVTPPVNVSQHGSFSHQSTFSATDMGQTRSESVNSLNTPFDGSYMMPTVTISNQEIKMVLLLIIIINNNSSTSSTIININQISLCSGYREMTC